MDLGVKDTEHWVFYPEVAGAGGLTAALQNEFIRLQIPLTPTPEFTPNKPHMDSFVMNCGHVKQDHRACSLHMAAQQRLFLCDFQHCGMRFGNMRSEDMGVIAQAMSGWLLEQMDRQQMVGRFGEAFEPTKGAPRSETQAYVEGRWQSLIRWLANETSILHKLSAVANAAGRKRELRLLLPYTSMLSLRFSRSISYPFSDDCPFVEPIDDGKFRVYSQNGRHFEAEHNGIKYWDTEHEVLGEGDAKEAADLLVANLPPNCGPAIYGTVPGLPNTKPDTSE